MEISATQCRQLILAIIKQNINDMILPYGYQNSIRDCRNAFNFLFNEYSDSYKGFCDWCDLAALDREYVQKSALRILCQEMQTKPWIRIRVAKFLHNPKQLRRLHHYSQILSSK